MTTTVTKEFRWEMAHVLENHNGLCKNLHGHNYRMLVEVKRLGEEVAEETKTSVEGMVVDFKDLGLFVNETVIEFFDHSFCYNEANAVNSAIALFLVKTIKQKIAPMPYRVTAENIAKFCYEKLQKLFVSRKINIRVSNITIYENDFSSSTYRGEE